MNQKIQDLMYHSGLTAQGCWDEMDEYDKQAIEKFAELIVQECIDCAEWVGRMNTTAVEPVNTAHAIVKRIEKHFGGEE